MNHGKEPDFCMPQKGRGSCGLTLLELLLVMAMVSILVCVSTWGGRQMVRGWVLKRAGHQVLEDLKAVQARAEMSSSLSVSNGALVLQRTFLVFDPTAQSYEAYVWQDHNGDNVAEAGECDRLWRKSLPPGVAFGWVDGIDRRACSNVVGPPTSAISFSSPTYAPCDDRPCIKFNAHGFSEMGPGAVYLSGGEGSLAITGTRPGHFTMCSWSGERWR
ncbi:MAG: prepilin-type N-terminal cleavage/methylation domain-containing protein [Desulfuromonadales bacterium]